MAGYAAYDRRLLDFFWRVTPQISEVSLSVVSPALIALSPTDSPKARVITIPVFKIRPPLPDAIFSFGEGPFSQRTFFFPPGELFKLVPSYSPHFLFFRDPPTP